MRSYLRAAVAFLSDESVLPDSFSLDKAKRESEVPVPKHDPKTEHGLNLRAKLRRLWTPCARQAHNALSRNTERFEVTAYIPSNNKITGSSDATILLQRILTLVNIPLVIKLRVLVDAREWEQPND